MTPIQFRRAVDAWHWNDMREWERVAVHARWIMSTTCGSETPTVDQLLGKEKEKFYSTIDEARAAGEPV